MRINLNIFCLPHSKHPNQQECIPVGCVPPALYRTGGLPNRDPPDRDPPGQRPCWKETPLPPDRDPPGQTPRTETPLWTETPPGQAPLERDPPTETPWTVCDRQRPPGQRILLDRDPPDRDPRVMWPVVHAGTETPPREQNHRHLWKHNLAATSLRSVMIVLKVF